MITTWTEAYQAWDDLLDEAYGPTIRIAGIEFYPHKILRECDPVAYRCYFNDWADEEDIDTDELIGYPDRH